MNEKNYTKYKIMRLPNNFSCKTDNRSMFININCQVNHHKQITTKRLLLL